MFGSFLLSLLVGSHHQSLLGPGPDIVMESISLKTFSDPYKIARMSTRNRRTDFRLTATRTNAGNLRIGKLVGYPVRACGPPLRAICWYSHAGYTFCVSEVLRSPLL